MTCSTSVEFQLFSGRKACGLPPQPGTTSNGGKYMSVSFRREARLLAVVWAWALGGELVGLARRPGATTCPSIWSHVFYASPHALE